MSPLADMYPEMGLPTVAPGPPLKPGPVTGYYGPSPTQPYNPGQGAKPPYYMDPPAPYQPQIMEAGIPLLAIPALIARFGPQLARLFGYGAVGYGAAQVLGLGEGGGVGGVNILGGQEGMIPGSMVPLGGPGLPEPPGYMIAKQWTANGAQFYMLLDGRIAVYSVKKRRWKLYRPARNLVISRNPKVNSLLKVEGKINSLMNSIARRAGMTRKRSPRRRRAPC